MYAWGTGTSFSYTIPLSLDKILQIPWACYEAIVNAPSPIASTKVRSVTNRDTVKLSGFTAGADLVYIARRLQRSEKVTSDRTYQV